MWNIRAWTETVWGIVWFVGIVYKIKTLKKGAKESCGRMLEGELICGIYVKRKMCEWERVLNGKKKTSTKENSDKEWKQVVGLKNFKRKWKRSCSESE